MRMKELKGLRKKDPMLVFTLTRLWDLEDMSMAMILLWACTEAPSIQQYDHLDSAHKKSLTYGKPLRIDFMRYREPNLQMAAGKATSMRPT